MSVQPNQKTVAMLDSLRDAVMHHPMFSVSAGLIGGGLGYGGAYIANDLIRKNDPKSQLRVDPELVAGVAGTLALMKGGPLVARGFARTLGRGGSDG